MVTKHYREAALTPPTHAAPPWWQRLLFRRDRAWAGDLWPWARARVGGRWAQVVVCFPRLVSGDESPWAVTWLRVGSCPNAWPRAEECGNAFDLIDARAQNRTIDLHRAGAHGGCDCEVYP